MGSTFILSEGKFMTHGGHYQGPDDATQTAGSEV